MAPMVMGVRVSDVVVDVVGDGGDARGDKLKTNSKYFNVYRMFTLLFAVLSFRICCVDGGAMTGP